MISYYLSPITNTRPARCVTLEEVYKMIISKKWAQTTRSLRSLSQKEQSGYKCRQLPFVTFSGSFAMRHASQLVRHSGLLCFDFDHVGNEQCVRELQRRLIADPQLDVRMAFRSPSGDGLKMVVGMASLIGLGQSERINREQIIEEHNTQYAKIAQHILRHHNIQVDKTNDVARACFLCHDGEAYIKLPSVVSTVNSQPTTVGTRHAASPIFDHRPSTVDQKLEYAIQRLEANRIDVTTHYYDWYRIGMALASHFGEAGRVYYHRISCYYPGYTLDETNKQYDRCLHYNNHRIGIGTLFYLINK